MLIAEIVNLHKLVNKSKDDAIQQQAKQLSVKRAKLDTEKAKQRAVAAQQRLQKAQTT